MPSLLCRRLLNSVGSCGGSRRPVQTRPMLRDTLPLLTGPPSEQRRTMPPNDDPSSTRWTLRIAATRICVVGCWKRCGQSHRPSPGTPCSAGGTPGLTAGYDAQTWSRTWLAGSCFVQIPCLVGRDKRLPVTNETGSQWNAPSQEHTAWNTGQDTEAQDTEAQMGPGFSP